MNPWPYRIAILFAVIGTAGACAAIYAHRNDPRKTCAEYADDNRDRVPARCFDDFIPDRP